MLKPLSWPDVEIVAANMRQQDRDEICALVDTNDPVTAVSALGFVSHYGVTAFHENQPVACCGVMHMHRGVASAFMFATDLWPKVAKDMTKWVLRDMLPTCYELGYHRLQAYSLANHYDAHRWLMFCGAQVEATVHGYGKDGEDYFLFTMDREALRLAAKVEMS